MKKIIAALLILTPSLFLGGCVTATSYTSGYNGTSYVYSDVGYVNAGYGGYYNTGWYGGRGWYGNRGWYGGRGWYGNRGWAGNRGWRGGYRGWHGRR